MTVSRCTIHHEGAGKPTDAPRGADGGYSYWIGPTYWTRLRAPEQSFATLNYNHVSLDICLSGDRMQYAVTDHDVELIRQVCADARNRDELVDVPDVVPHNQSPGSSTVCPGDNTMAVWSKIVGACRAPVLVTPKPVPVEDEDEMKPWIAATEGKPTWYVGEIVFQLDKLDAFKDLEVRRVTAAENDRIAKNAA